jgi:hypothetical protein
MDDGNEVKDLTEVAKDAFLQEADRIQAEKPNLYNLEREFARTRNNRSWRVYIFLAVFVVAAVTAAVLLTLHFDRENRSVPVDIADFEDVNLKDLLNAASRNANDLDGARQALADAEADLAVKRQALQSDLAGQIEVLKAQDPSMARLEGEEKRLRREADAREKSLVARSSPRIAELRAEVATAKLRAESYNQAQLDAARKREQVLNNEQHLHQIELQKTKAYYENKLKELADQDARETAALKENQARVIKAMEETRKREIAALILTYNPLFATEALKGILASPIDAGLASAFAPLSAQLRDGGFAAEDSLAAMRDALQKRALLFGRLREIPYRNSVPPALAHLDYLDIWLMRAYEDLAARLIQRIHADEEAIAARDGVIARDRSAFQYYARKIRENGFLIDVRDVQKIVPFVSPSHAVADGDLGLVFRADDEYIGTIRFTVSGAEVSARVVELAANKQFEPFDKFLVKKKEGT